MKALMLILSLLSLGASARPELEDAVVDGALSYRGGDLPRGDQGNLLSADSLHRQCSCWRCWGTGHSCTPYKCQCGGSNGCYSCNGGAYVCQGGPGSGQCIGGQ
ncbi:hypothetical protein E4U42_005206 [Claviceps africana]|uniref:Uncharacterized protein n=1 Tax=Claviceps africana TaxID=83212 RepID=A0A8K0J683_9HYPO|nr:hypothetical protein E4U42_005206 [Claviceps africana]